jgi:hypothetical protein
MPTTITLNGIPHDIYDRPKGSAQAHGPSLNSEAIACLEILLMPKRGVHTHVLAYLLVPGKYTASAEKLLASGLDSAAPRLWRCELRTILATCIRLGQLETAHAVALFSKAAEILRGEQYDAETPEVLRHAKKQPCLGVRLQVRCAGGVLGRQAGHCESAAGESIPDPHTAACLWCLTIQLICPQRLVLHGRGRPTTGMAWNIQSIPAAFVPLRPSTPRSHLHSWPHGQTVQASGLGQAADQVRVLHGLASSGASAIKVAAGKQPGLATRVWPLSCSGHTSAKPYAHPWT